MTTISIDFKELINAQANLSNPRVFHALQNAMVESLDYVKMQYIEAAQNFQKHFGVRIPFGEQYMGRRYRNAIANAETIYPYHNEFSAQLRANYADIKPVEEAVLPYDMKLGLLAGPNSKTSATGSKYNTVPFKTPKHKQPTSVVAQMETIKPAMTTGHPKEVAKVAKFPQGAPTAMSRGMLTKAGYAVPYTEPGAAKAASRSYSVLKTQIPGTQGQQVRRRVGGYEWKSGRWEGMVSRVRHYERATETQFTVFRRVSTNSDPNSWIHPGHPAYDLTKIVTEKATKGVTDIIGRAFDNMGA